MTSTIKYPTVVHNVREVGLYGSADLAYWREQLRAYNLHPYSFNGRAQIYVNATALGWKNIPSRECIIAVAVSQDEDETTEDGAFLLHAFNSRWFFAWVERRSFASPYYHAQIEFEIAPPHFSVWTDGAAPITAAWHTSALGEIVQQTWEHPIVLPPLTPAQHAPQKFFVANLSGATQVVPFAPEDEFTLQPLAAVPVVQQLLDSKFAPDEWRIRTDATHCKSNTLTVGSEAATPFAMVKGQTTGKQS